MVSFCVYPRRRESEHTRVGVDHGTIWPTATVMIMLLLFMTAGCKNNVYIHGTDLTYCSSPSDMSDFCSQAIPKK